MQTGGCQGLEEGGSREYLLSWYKIFFWGNENVSELDRHMACTTVNVMHATELHTKIVQFYVNFALITHKNRVSCKYAL